MGPMTRAQLEQAIQSLTAPASTGISVYRDPEGNNITPPTSAADPYRLALRYLDQYGVNSTSQLPQPLQEHLAGSGDAQNGALGGLGNFVTNPAFLTLAGGVGGVYAGAAGAAGAGSGGAYGSAGTSGLEAAYGGATGFDAAGNALYSGVGAGTAGAAAAGAGGTGGAGSAAGTTASGTALSRILAGNGTTEDYLQLVGQVAPAALGAYASNKQTGALTDLADKYMAMGAPYRDELARISADPNAFYTSPTATNATEAVLRRLSATHGNTAGSPYAQALTVDALNDQYGRERDRLAGFGGLTQYNAAAPGAATNAIGSQANMWNAIGGGIADVTTPRTRTITMQDILRGVQV